MPNNSLEEDMVVKGVAVLPGVSHIESLENHNMALRIHKELNNRSSIAMDYNNIGLVFKKQGRFEDALKNQQEAFKINNELNDIVGLAKDYRNIGNTYNEIDRLAEALENHNKSLEIHNELNNRVEMAGDYYNLSFVLSKTSKVEALESLDKASKLLEEFGKENNYRHPLIEDVESRVAYLQGKNRFALNVVIDG